MERLILCLCVLAAMAESCGDPIYLGEVGNSSSKNSGSPSNPDRRTLYVTGVEYPEGVDWQKDIGYDIAGSTLFLMRNGEKIVELAVGYDKCVSVDADMHRCIEGHLYTDFSTDDETVVMVDGEEAFRYSGREMMESMCIHDGRIHTLSVPRSGSQGWVYRCDGEMVCSSDEGDPVGGLYEDNGEIVFTYSIDNNGAKTYYMLVDNIANSLSFNSKITNVFDVRRIGGIVNHISANNGKLVAMEDETQVADFGKWSSGNEVDMWIYYDGMDRFYAGTTGNGTGIWREGDEAAECDGPLAGFSLWGNNYICAIKNDKNEMTAICCDGVLNEWPEGAELIYSTCMATNGIEYTVGLNNKEEGNAPAIWMNGTLTTYGFNGFFTHVDYW